jgi:malate dehydrogenase
VVPYVSIIGSGNVGANAAFFIAEKGVADVLLYDVKAGFPAGKSLDMMEAAPIRAYRNRISGTDSIEELRESDIIVMAAGSVRGPGMKREDLFATNRGLAASLAREVARLAPEAKVIVATEPVDPITQVFVQESGLPRERVFGLGAFLDATRLRYFIARELSVSMENVSAMVIGRHSDAMIGLPRYCTVSGVPIPQLLRHSMIEELLAETRDAGDLIADLARRSTAYYAPSAAVAELVDSIHMDLKRVFPVSVLLDGEYGLMGSVLSLPAVIGRDGIERVLQPRLTDDEKERFERSAGEVRAIVEGKAS